MSVSTVLPNSWSKERIERAYQHLTPEEQAEVDQLLTAPFTDLWRPFPGPQTEAFRSEADELFYGGAAGGGKTDLLLGLALTAHRDSIIFRREYPQLKGILKRSREIVGQRGRFNGATLIWHSLPGGRSLEFGAVQHDSETKDDKQKFQGRAHDLKGFDELPHFTQAQYRFLIGWLRPGEASPQQRCRVVATGNPPAPGQGEWVVKEWAPWLDSKFPDPALPGELRWYAMLADELVWLREGTQIEHNGETIRPRSRTFIPARVDDNPIYRESGYKAVLQSLPEPLRSQLLYGDFNAITEDDPWQCIPTAWVLAAQERWRERAAPDVPLTQLGVDVARGGKDQTIICRRFGEWFAPLEKHPGKTTPDGPAVAALTVKALGELRVPVNIDAIGVGTSPLDILKGNGVAVHEFNGSAAATDPYTGKPFTDKSGKYKLRNLRTAAYWRLREALDPTNGQDLALPDDRELLGDLCAHRWTLGAAGIEVESKDDVKERIGRSPDCSDAVIYALWPVPRLDFTFI